MILVQHQDFDVGEEVKSFQAIGPHIGAVVSFVGLVREFTDHGSLTAIELEHYPVMTQKVLEEIVAEAKSRWEIEAVKVIHRVGRLLPSEQIVFVGVASRHRAEAFSACAFIIDFLKTDAPFWKKECFKNRAHWVEAKGSDQQKTKDWLRGEVP